jgi:hypothetical protein
MYYYECSDCAARYLAREFDDTCPKCGGVVRTLVVPA